MKHRIPVSLLLLGLLIGGCSTKSQPPPVISAITAAPTAVLRHSAVQLTCTAATTLGTPLTYTWTCANGSITGNGASAEWLAPAALGAVTIQCKVTDAKGKSTSGATTVTVREANAPIISKVIPTPQTFRYQGGTVDMLAEISAEAQPVSAQVTVLSGGDTVTTFPLTHTAEGYTGAWTAPANEHTDGRDDRYTLQVTATDAEGHRAVSDSATVTVQEAVPPVIRSVTIEPSSFHYTGGEARITAAIDAEAQPAAVQLLILADGQTLANISLSRSATGYAGVWVAPANLRATGQAKEYALRVTATDSVGHRVTRENTTITVQEAAQPVIRDLSVSPATMRFIGGTVTITTDIDAEALPLQPQVTITAAGQTVAAFPLSMTAGGYAGTWTTPANLRTDGQAIAYTLALSATDAVGHTANIAPRQVTVQAPPAPPGAP